MSSRNATVAEAVKTSLNTAAVAGTFGPTFTAKRVYVPATSLQDLASLTVKVFAVEEVRERITRGKNQYDVSIQVGVQKRLTATADPEGEAANTEIDALLEIAERIADFYEPGMSAGAGQWIRTAHSPIADPDHLMTHRVFTNVILFTFRII